MAELVYDETGRLLFTEEMKNEYTIIMPQMLPVMFHLLKRIIELEGYKIDILTSTNREIVETGLKYVHNDTCYPALLVIGQLIEAVQSGRYDSHKVALLISQTGGGCRASNYIHLLRKALKKAGLEYIPVISINLSGLEKNPGFKIPVRVGRRMVYGMMYGDLLIHLGNQCRSYELEKGATDRLISRWTDDLVELFVHGKGMSRGQMKTYMQKITRDFSAIPRNTEKKTRVGIRRVQVRSSWKQQSV